MQREQVLESVCRASLAVRRCRTSNHCSVATNNSLGALALSCAGPGVVYGGATPHNLRTRTSCDLSFGSACCCKRDVRWIN